MINAFVAVCLSVCVIVLPANGVVDPCGDRNDCIGLVAFIRCANGSQPDIDQDLAIVLLDTTTGAQFSYQLELSNVYLAELRYVAAAGELVTSDTYRAHLVYNGAYVGEWSSDYSPPTVIGFIYDLPDCPYRVFLPIAGRR
jgi:hypothetical protein